MKRLSDILPSAVEQKDVLRAARAQSVFVRWKEAVGDVLAQKTVPDRYDHGILWVSADSATWAQELRMREETVLERLNELAAEPGLFRQVKVSLRPRFRDLMG
ncbi:MAG: DUF721 domain-containing protein [Armatimonadetes bacterium]|nr:DUF721 domain-containing protein [Armatimonadota bacterium]